MRLPFFLQGRSIRRRSRIVWMPYLLMSSALQARVPISKPAGADFSFDITLHLRNSFGVAVHMCPVDVLSMQIADPICGGHRSVKAEQVTSAALKT